MKLTEVFDKAVRSFDKNGWGRYAYQRRDGRRCAGGHIAFGADSLTPLPRWMWQYSQLEDEETASNDYNEPCEEALEFFADENRLWLTSDQDRVADVIGEWNDDSDRTAEQVRAALVLALDKAREKEYEEETNE